jgi:hypothetical protein
MQHRFAVLEEGTKPRIFKVPVNQTARLVNEFPDRDVEVFEALNDAKQAALAIIIRREAAVRPSITNFSNQPRPENQALRESLAELTEDSCETYYF